MSAVNTESIPPSHTNGVIEDGYDEDEKMKARPADIDADMREMERRKRVELIMNSRLFREELERIIESQIKAGNSSAGLLQQISDMVGSKYSGINNNLFRSASCAVPINDIRGVEAMGYAKGEKILRCKLAALFRLIDLHGWSQGIYNHVTARLSQQEEHFLVNPYGLLYSEVTASSLVKVDMQGNVIESGTTNFSVNVTGFQLHAAIYAARPDLKCIVHLHTPSVLAVSSLKDGLLPICQEAAVIGDISHHSYIGIPNDPEERDKIVRNLGPNNKVIFLTNHGALCCGGTIEETFFYAYNTVNACETQLKVLPLGKDNLVLLSDEMKKSMYDAARKIPENLSPPVSNVPSAAAATEKRWRIGGLEFEALMRMLDNAGFRTGYVYRQPLIKGELPRPRNDVEVPPAVSSLGYLFEEEELYKGGQWRRAYGGKGSDRIRWLNSPNVYQKVEILETGTTDPKKITKWVDANNEEWVADGSPSHTSTPVKIENALQFVPKNTNPKEFKKLQQLIKENRRADKITSGPQSHILEGVSWEEAKKLQDANMSGTSDQVILVGAASKGIIQREYQHNATVYKTPYAKNPFDAITDEEIENYKKDITRKQRGDSYYDEDESDALSSSLPPSEMRVIQIETTTVPKASQAEVVLSDDNYDYYSEELRKFIVRIWEVKKMRPILKNIGESMLRPVCPASMCDEDESRPDDRPPMNEIYKQIAQELMTRFKQGSVFKQRSVRPAFLPIAAEAPEFHDVSYKSSSFDCSDTEITTLIELPSQQQRGRRYSRGSLESVHDFSSDPTTEDEEEPMSPECDLNRSSLLSLSSYIGQEFENPEESNEMTASKTKTNVSDDTSLDDVTVICNKEKNFDDENVLDFDVDDKGEFSDTSLSSGLMQGDDDDDGDIQWNTYESLNDVDDDYFVHESGDTKPYDEGVTSFIEKTAVFTKYKPDLAVIYEEGHASDSKCSLRSILEDSTVYAEPQCERSDTPDTYIIEEEPRLDHDVWASLKKCIAYADALLNHLKNVKIDRNDSETVSSAMANCFPALDTNGVDSDAHTISDTSLISCLADSTEDLEALRNDTCSFDTNDSSSERVLDSGILMEDFVTCSSEGDYTDMKLCSEVISTDIATAVSPTEGRASSGSDEAEDIVWITQIEKIFDYDADDFCLTGLFQQSDEIGTPKDDTGQGDGSVEADIASLNVVIDTGPDDRNLGDVEIDDNADSVIESDDQSDDHLVDAQNPSEHHCTFRNDVENIPTDVCDLDNERLTESTSSVDSVHTSIFINEPCSHSTLPCENNVNAGVTLQVPETISSSDVQTENVPDSVVIERMQPSLPNDDHVESISNRNCAVSSRQSCSCDQFDVHSNCEICKYVKEAATVVNCDISEPQSNKDFDFDFDIFDSVIISILAAENELPCGVDDTFIEYKNIRDIFGDSFLDDTNDRKVPSDDLSAEQDVEKMTPSFDGFQTNFDLEDGSSYTCLNCDEINAATPSSSHSEEENTSSAKDQVSSDSGVLLDWNGAACQINVDDSNIVATPQNDDGLGKAEKYDDDVSNDIFIDDLTENCQRQVHLQDNDQDVELPNQLLEGRIEFDEGIVDVAAEENNNYISIDDENYLASRDVIDEANDDVVGEQSELVELSECIDDDVDDVAMEKDLVSEPELSVESSENNDDDVTVVEMGTGESYESTDVEIDENNDIREPSQVVESSGNNDDVITEPDEYVESLENIDEAVAVENYVHNEPSDRMELVENSDDVAAAYSNVVEDLSERSIESAENTDDDESVENYVYQEPSENVELTENNESTESTDDYESIEDDADQESSEAVELIENSDDVAAAENYVAEELSKESTENTEDNESEKNDTDWQPSERVELAENTDDDESVENDDDQEPSERVELAENYVTEELLEESTENTDGDESIENDVDREPAKRVESAENNASTENTDDDESIENDADREPAERVESAENNASTENTDDDESIENDADQESPQRVELTENSDDVAEDLSEGSIESTNNSDDAESTENDTDQDPSEHVESAENNELIENTDDDESIENDTDQEPSEDAESAENTDDVAAAENYVAEELSQESTESTENTQDDESVENDVTQEPSEFVESPENCGDVVADDPSELAESIEIIGAAVTMPNDVIGDPSEDVESPENSHDVAIAESNVGQESSESTDSSENIDDAATVENYLTQEPVEIAESPKNSDDVATVENDVIREPSESVGSNEIIDQAETMQNDVIGEHFGDVESPENSDDVAIAEDNIGQESIESSENIEEVVTLENDVIETPPQPLEVLENIEDVTEGENNGIAEPIESSENVDDVTVDNDFSYEPEEFAESPENNDHFATAVGDVIEELSDLVESIENVDCLVSAKNDVIVEPSERIESLENNNDVIADLSKSTAESIDSVAIVQNDPIGEHSESLGPIENDDDAAADANDSFDESPEIFELAENGGDSAIITNDRIPTFSTEPIVITSDLVDQNQLEYEPEVLRNHVVAVSDHNTLATVPDAAAVAIATNMPIVNEEKEAAAANSSSESPENYVTISDGSSKPEDDCAAISDSSSQLQRSYVTVSEASIDKSGDESSSHRKADGGDPSQRSTPVRPKPSPEPRQWQNNLRTSVRFSNHRKSMKRSSPPKRESSTDDDDAKRSKASGYGDEKKLKLEQDVTEYSVKLKLHIEWDNKRSSSDSNSTKSSSFEDSLNYSESTSEVKRDRRDDNDDGNQHCHHRFEQVTRLLTDFKNDYPKFITYEYFSPKVKIRWSPKKPTPRAKTTPRKSLSTESSSSSNGRYHRYCHITRDLSVVDNNSANGDDCANTAPIATPKRVSPSFIKNLHQISTSKKNRAVRKPFKSRNSNFVSSSGLKTSTPVLTAAEFITNESIVECLTANTLSPIVNSLEEFELIESLLTSCEK